MNYQFSAVCTLAARISPVLMLLGALYSSSYAQPTPGPAFTSAPTPAPEAPESEFDNGISYDTQSALLTSVYPLALDRMSQVTQNSYNWTGIRDASLGCEIGFTPQAIVIRGHLLDDQPFVQPIAYPGKPDWWHVTYAADGVEMILEDITSATNRLHLALNFSSAGLEPKIQVLSAPLVANPGVLTSADFRVRALRPEDIPPSLPDKSKPLAGFRFEAAVPSSGLAEPRFFSNPMRITIRLHDLDGGIETYLKMEDAIEKRE